MPRETNAAKRERAIEVCERLNRRYGPVECFLDHENPFRLLIAVLLSAQTTDAEVVCPVAHARGHGRGKCDRRGGHH